MWLSKLTLFQFKNYTQAEMTFSEGINCFTGKNGAGKTNILDAIHYLSFTKSWFHVNDGQNMLHGAEMMLVQGLFEKEQMQEQIAIGLKKNAKKSVRCNGNEYDKLAEHIGKYPLVMIVPADINLIYEGSEDRRRMLDMSVSQINKLYLDDLIRYNKALEQRNKQLRIFAEGTEFDRELLFIWEKTLEECGKRIFEQRKAYVEAIEPVFQSLYLGMSSGTEMVHIQYLSPLEKVSWGDLFEENLQRDLFLQRTSAGVHKDDFLMQIDGYPLKKFGSQGQQKSFIISLKLAEYFFLKERSGTKPLLLLDDIFEKIDEHRALSLLAQISTEEFGQIFITDTHTDRMKMAFKNHPAISFFEIDQGKIVPLPREIQQRTND